MSVNIKIKQEFVQVLVTGWFRSKWREKTYLLLCRHQIEGKSHVIKEANKPYDTIVKLIYLEMSVTLKMEFRNKTFQVKLASKMVGSGWRQLCWNTS